MIYILILILLLEGCLICWCYFPPNLLKHNEQSFSPHLYLTGLNGTIYYLDLSENKYILVVKLYDELFDVIAYSKSKKIYKEGEDVKIIGYSDGLYFIE